MIKVESLTIKEFRGIRDLTLDLKGENFAICGPNGTGKSGIVDALEFVLTGSVSRLSGEGRGEISLKQHAPHVDKRNDPDKARVSATISIPSLKKTVVIERSAKTPATIHATPDEPAVREILKQLERRPEVVLSRRELIRYVLATPGKRAEEIQALLHLDRVEKVRAALQKIANRCERQLGPLATARASAANNLSRALGIPNLTKEKLVAAANAKRAILGLAEFSTLTQTTSLKDGMATPNAGQPQRIPKAQANADISAAREALADLNSPTTTAASAEVIRELQALAADTEFIMAAQKTKFYAAGIDLVEIDACPFCDSRWDVEKLKHHVKSKLDRLRDLSRKRANAENKIAPMISLLEKARSAVELMLRHAVLVVPAIDTEVARQFSNDCKAAIDKLTSFLPPESSIGALEGMKNIPRPLSDMISKLEKTVGALPDPTKEDAAREWLTIAQERLEVWRDAERRHKGAKERFERARQVFDIYSAASDKVLTSMYADVEDDFAGLYRFVNRDDEDRFSAELIPSMGKLGFGVDFYGRGFFPPGAYHSEGHQDSMGLCLYLALMRHLNGAAFTFSVLDDVLMSVDTMHRREVCSLLKKEFPNTQFVLTTHDPVWLRHMKTEGLIGSRSGVQFRGWDIDRGPSHWDERDIWVEIDEHLQQNGVRAASALLRHYLEYISAELCHRLRAPVEFRGDGRYQLGQLLPAAVSRLRKLYKSAKEAASSWNQRDTVEEIDDRQTEFGKLVETSNVEQWQINVAVHFNSWENLSPNDFRPVVNAFREVVNGFACSACGGYLRVSPEQETPDSLRCSCGAINLNLGRKKA
jgi:hypothetical protein